MVKLEDIVEGFDPKELGHRLRRRAVQAAVTRAFIRRTRGVDIGRLALCRDGKCAAWRS